MEIEINDFRKVLSVQAEFGQAFPYLQLRFFQKDDSANGYGKMLPVKNNSLLIGECRTQHNVGVIAITPDMTVSSLEKQLYEQFGLRVQIVRKSGRAWIETSVTGAWTLMEQNKQGFDLSQ